MKTTLLTLEMNPNGYGQHMHKRDPVNGRVVATSNTILAGRSGLLRNRVGGDSCIFVATLKLQLKGTRLAHSLELFSMRAILGKNETTRCAERWCG